MVNQLRLTSSNSRIPSMVPPTSKGPSKSINHASAGVSSKDVKGQFLTLKKNDREKPLSHSSNLPAYRPYYEKPQEREVEISLEKYIKTPQNSIIEEKRTPIEQRKTFTKERNIEEKNVKEKNIEEKKVEENKIEKKKTPIGYKERPNIRLDNLGFDNDMLSLALSNPENINVCI